MHNLSTGEYFGICQSSIHVNGLIISDTKYREVDSIPWHYHENPYFAFIYDGHYLETGKKGSQHCTKGMIQYHYEAEPHANGAFSTECDILNVEIESRWFGQHHIDSRLLHRDILLTHPSFRIMFIKLLKELRMNDGATPLSVEGIVLQLFGDILRKQERENSVIPHWAKQLKELLPHLTESNVTLSQLAKLVNIHPVHISRHFPKYFNCTLGEYMRKTKIDKSLLLLSDRALSLTEIAYMCGFADQSHFGRVFKEFTGTTPTLYRKYIA